MTDTDWEKSTVPLGELCRVVRGSSPRPAGDPRYFDGDFLPWITVAELTRDEAAYVTTTQSALTKEGANHTRVFEPGTVLLSNSGATLGVPKITAIRAGANDGVAGFLDLSPSVFPPYLYYFLSSLTHHLRTQVASGVGQPNLNTDLIAEIQLSVPPLPAQKAIVAVLSAWDRAIEQTTALIAAKERLKQGLMQQLFGEAAHSQRQLESKLCHLGDVASETTRRNGGGLGTDAVYSVTKASGMIPMPLDTIGSDIARYKLVRPKAFAYNPMRINIGSIARWEGESDVLVSPDYVVFECGPELDPDYLNHFRRGHVWDSYVKRSGDGSVRVRIYFDHLSRMRIRLPGIQEQQRIAKVLDAANAELLLLERKLHALKKQKRGLMQQLLTGNTRLPAKLQKVKDE